MGKVLAFSITILLGIHKISAQDYLRYYEIINKAEIANLDQDFKQSDSLYQIAFRLVQKPFKEDFLLAAINSDKFLENEKTFDYLKKGIRNGLTLKRIKKELTGFKNSQQWKELKAEYNSLRENYVRTLNLPIRYEIAEMLRKDQKARAPIFGSIKQMQKVDNYNYQRLLEIIKRNNDKWPGFSIIGESLPNGKYDVTGNIALIILHFKKDQVEKLKPIMLQAVLDGEMYPYHFARIIDYKNIADCQAYGTYLDGRFTSPICDCEKANFEREKIGFESIEDYYRKRNSKYECKK